jgi:hypothetical protein
MLYQVEHERRMWVKVTLNIRSKSIKHKTGEQKGNFEFSNLEAFTSLPSDDVNDKLKNNSRNKNHTRQE